MPKKHKKASGTNFENRYRKYLENYGWKVVRSAGSGGPADLVAFHRQQVRPLIVQCKASPTPGLAKTERMELHTLNKFYSVKVLVVCRQEGSPWDFIYYAFADPTSQLEIVEEPAWIKKS